MVVDSRGGRKTLIILHSTLLLPARGDAASWQRPWSAGLSTRVLTGRSTRAFFGGCVCVCVFFFFLFFFSFSLLAVLLSSRHLLTPAKHQNISS